MAPAIAAGCTFIAKPSEQTPASTLEFARLVEEAGFPPGVFNVVTGSGDLPGKALVSHPGVDKIAFTGSTMTGINVVRAAAENLSRVTLELGGKSPNIVFEDADLEAATNGAVAGIFAATGQTCIAGSRLIVHESVHDELVERLVTRARTIKLGDPLDPATEMGPVAFRDQLDKVLGLIDSGVDDGAKLACGGGQDPDAGELFVQPTILTDVDNGMQIAQDEIFGPVLSVLRFSTEEEAIELANDTRFGLAAGVWTKDVHRAHRGRASDPGRHGVGQRLPRGLVHDAVRRVRHERLGPRERGRRDRPLHRDEVGLGGAHGRDARPVRDGLIAS